MDAETDPMLGGPEEQEPYVARVIATMEQQVDADKAARRSEVAPTESPAVIVGAVGQAAGIRVVE